MLAGAFRSILLILLVGCGGREGSHLPADAGSEPDADLLDGGTSTSCAADDPRAVEPEPFVGPVGLRDRLLAAMGAARETLDVAAYILDDPTIVDALEDAAARGVRVRVLLDGMRTENGPVLERLAAAGVDASAASSMFSHFHPKFLVIDGELGIVMSANLNRYSMETERNHGVVLRDPRDVADLTALFEVDFSSVPADLSCTRLVISPNNARDRIESLVGEATDELRLQQLSLTDDSLRAALAARAAAGVRVRVILADPAWIESNTETAAVLREGGAEVRFLRALENHAKLIVADQSAFVGSENLSWTSLERNREVGIITEAPSAVGPLVESFEGDWASAEP